jgi:cardiolipin synthase
VISADAVRHSLFGEAKRPAPYGGRTAAGAIQIGRTVGAAITNRRALGPAEARIMGAAGLLLVATSVIAVMWP